MGRMSHEPKREAITNASEISTLHDESNKQELTIGIISDSQSEPKSACQKFDCSKHNGGYGTPCNDDYNIASAESPDWMEEFDEEFNLSTVFETDNFEDQEYINTRHYNYAGVFKRLKSFIAEKTEAARKEGYEKGLADGSEIERFGSIGGRQKSTLA